MLTQEIRRQFLQYFRENHHTIVPSSPVIPYDDPTLLFINAGMNQFKDVFLGKSHRDYVRAATSQKCIRVGGKHNDLDNVGHTSRHLTFFEMIGNFSFGDYFKKEAIKFAWDVSTKVFGFDPDRIWPSVFREDDEAFELWKDYVPVERITRLDEKDNFWAMGETGPCGPCSELYYDRGAKYGAAKKLSEDKEGNRYLEFWNLVFMQYNRQIDGSMVQLPKPSIDTGAGLERVLSLKMDVDSVFETDVLRSLIAEIEQISGVAYSLDDSHRSAAFRVIADHLRCLAFAIADGVQPSNVDRGYVLRKVLRRAVRYGRTLGLEDPFLAKILPRLVSSMGSDYIELQKSQDRIAEILISEEEAFSRTLRRGGNLLNSIIEKAQTHEKKISGDDAFKLKDTYGFPLEEVLLLAKDADLSVDTERYQSLEQEAKERSRSAQKTTRQEVSENVFSNFVKEQGVTEFLGYAQHAALGNIKGLVVNNEFVDTLHPGEEGIVILDKTPFYAEMGGQVGDVGTLEGTDVLFQVDSCYSPYKGLIAHSGKLKSGKLSIGQSVQAKIDGERRQKIANNHTATHLLHWALHHVLGEHVKQGGSVVDANRLRFDFSHHKALTPKELADIEDLVNCKIRENLPVKGYELSYDEAQNRRDIKQFFGEKYGSVVRVIDIDYSKELCGGTHTSALGTIGLFRIAKESSIAAGMRRIEAVTGAEAEALMRESDKLLDQAGSLLKVPSAKLIERLEKLIEENKELALHIKTVKKGIMAQAIAQLTANVETVNGVPLLAAEVEIPFDELRLMADEIMLRLPSLLLVLGAKSEGKCQLIACASEDLVNKGVKAADIVKAVSPIIEGNGGGKANYAQASGKAPQKIKEALVKARELVNALT